MCNFESSLLFHRREGISFVVVITVEEICRLLATRVKGVVVLSQLSFSDALNPSAGEKSRWTGECYLCGFLGSVNPIPSLWRHLEKPECLGAPLSSSLSSLLSSPPSE
jgi:hypothetical protein